jgi:hypothetical protein
VLAVTDDDCLPEPGWAAALVAVVHDGAAVAQGCTRPVDGARGAWDRAVRVEEPSWLFETCNLGFERQRFVELGGFPTLQVLGRLARGFGEDVVFGALAVLATLATRRPALLLGTVPWMRRVLPVARFRTGRPLAFRLAQEAVADAVGLASLLEGSVRHRRLVL